MKSEKEEEMDSNEDEDYVIVLDPAEDRMEYVYEAYLKMKHEPTLIIVDREREECFCGCLHCVNSMDPKETIIPRNGKNVDVKCIEKNIVCIEVDGITVGVYYLT